MKVKNNSRSLCLTLILLLCDISPRFSSDVICCNNKQQDPVKEPKRRRSIFSSLTHFFVPSLATLMSNDGSSSAAVYQTNLRQALLAGAMAGTAVDTALFPLGNMTTTPFDAIFRRHWSEIACRYDQNQTAITGRVYSFWRFSRRIFWPAICGYRQCSQWWVWARCRIREGDKSLILSFSLLKASLFFVTYEATKRLLGASFDKLNNAHFIHMAAASFGEIVSDSVATQIYLGVND